MVTGGDHAVGLADDEELFGALVFLVGLAAAVAFAGVLALAAVVAGLAAALALAGVLAFAVVLALLDVVELEGLLAGVDDGLLDAAVLAAGGRQGGGAGGSAEE